MKRWLVELEGGAYPTFRIIEARTEEAAALEALGAEPAAPLAHVSPIGDRVTFDAQMTVGVRRRGEDR